MSEQEELLAVLKSPAELVRFLPIRIVMRKNVDGRLEGICEESFSMGLYEHNVRIWWSGKAYSMFGEHLINGVNDAKYNAKEGDFVFDPLADDCPVEIDWARWLSATSKFGQRNAQFKIKGE